MNVSDTRLALLRDIYTESFWIRKINQHAGFLGIISSERLEAAGAIVMCSVMHCTWNSPWIAAVFKIRHCETHLLHFGAVKTNDWSINTSTVKWHWWRWYWNSLPLVFDARKCDVNRILCLAYGDRFCKPCQIEGVDQQKREGNQIGDPLFL